MVDIGNSFSLNSLRHFADAVQRAGVQYYQQICFHNFAVGRFHKTIYLRQKAKGFGDIVIHHYRYLFAGFFQRHFQCQRRAQSIAVRAYMRAQNQFILRQQQGGNFFKRTVFTHAGFPLV